MNNNKKQNNEKKNNSQNNLNQIQQEQEVETYVDKDDKGNEVGYMFVGTDNIESEIDTKSNNNENVIVEDSNKPDEEYLNYKDDYEYKEANNDDNDDNNNDDDIQYDYYYGGDNTKDETNAAVMQQVFDNDSELPLIYNYSEANLEGFQWEYYDNGALKSHFRKINNQLHGECSFYHPNGALQSAGKFINGYKYGNWEEYDENGNKLSSIDYDCGKKNGYEERYYKNFGTALKGRNKNGKPVGKFKEYYEDGKISKRYNYDKNGLLDGEYITVYPNGCKQSEGYYNHGMPYGIYIERYESGNISKICRYDEYGQLTGKCTTYYENGKKKLECNFKNDRFAGPYREWHDNGQKAIECNFENGIIVGKYQEWHNNGNLAKEEDYNNKGERDGYSTTFYPDEKKKSEGYYQNDRLEGEYKEWYDNDNKQIAKSCKYENGIIVDEYKEWHKNGNIARKERYDKAGLLEGKRITYYKDGKKKLECEYKNDRLEGLYTEWYDNKWTAKKCYYKNDLLVGPYQEWHDNGNIAKKCYYNENGELDGKYVCLDRDGNVIQEGEYKNGKEDGTWRMYFKESKTMIVGKFKDGKEDGIFEIYDTESENKDKPFSKIKYKDGVEIVVHEHSIANEKNETTLEEKDQNGKNEYEVFYPNGLLKRFVTANGDGVHVDVLDFNEAGNRIAERSYKNGYLDGISIEYDSEGRMRTWTWYSKGVVRKQFVFDNGKVTCNSTPEILDLPDLSNWVPSKEQKQIIDTLYNGDKTDYLIEMNLKNDDRYCTEEKDKKGVLISKTFEYTLDYCGKEHIKHIINYDENGKVTSAKRYINGKLRRKIEFDPTGNKPMTKVCYDFEGVKITEVENYFNKDKNEIWTGKVEDGKLRDGIVKHIGQDGKIDSGYKVIMGGKIRFYEYNNDGQLIYKGDHNNWGKRDGDGVEYSPTLKFPYYFQAKKGDEPEYMEEKHVPVFDGRYENGMRKYGTEYQLPAEGIIPGSSNTYNTTDVKKILPKVYEGSYHLCGDNNRGSGVLYENGKEVANVEYHSNGLLKYLCIKKSESHGQLCLPFHKNYYKYDEDGILTKLNVYEPDKGVIYHIEINSESKRIECTKYDNRMNKTYEYVVALTNATRNALPKAQDFTSIDNLPKYDDILNALEVSRFAKPAVAEEEVEEDKEEKKEQKKEQKKKTIYDEKNLNQFMNNLSMPIVPINELRLNKFLREKKSILNDANNSDLTEGHYNVDITAEPYNTDITEEPHNVNTAEEQENMSSGDKNVDAAHEKTSYVAEVEEDKEEEKEEEKEKKEINNSNDNLHKLPGQQTNIKK